ncbi:MAG: GWxTD domain-containing protein [Ignavibacteriales bacterium]|nr:GWxTD domain-containing protein [Ignavibacteriales bacterium]
MRNKIFILLGFITFFVNAQAQESSYQSGEPFKVTVDYARFYGDSLQTYIELYYGFSESMLKYIPDSGGLKGQLNFKLDVKKGANTAYSKEWIVPHLIPTGTEITSQSLVGLQSFGLPEGEYSLILRITDENMQSKRDSVYIALLISNYPVDKEYLSDIELCTSIQTANDKQSLFYKNTLDVVPNPSKLYGTGLPILYYYAIAYNLALNNNSGNIIVRTSVLDAVGNEVIAKDKPKPRLYNASVEVGTVNVSALRTGIYIFRMQLTDSLKTTLAQSEKKFFIYKHGSTPDSSLTSSSSPVLESKYSVLTEEEVNQNFEYTKYISTDLEKEQFEQLTDLKAKQKFLYEFWKRRATGPNSILDEAYYSRVKQADQQFTTPFRSGWKSDRGRVWILYGQYDEIERFSNSTESNPYEIWQYHNIQGGVIFVFIDRENIGNYMLMHSTHRDEMHEELWYEKYALKMR